jgi:magnesium-protoporphyrin O-methyltransferase
VVAIDVAGSLVAIGRDRAPAGLNIDWRVGDMLDPALGTFDHVVAMDSLIHYKAADIVAVVGRLAESTRRSIALTFAPRTPLLMAMLGMGRLFPRGDKSPAILPVRDTHLRAQLQTALPGARIGRDRRISASFYTSHALEVVTG